MKVLITGAAGYVGSRLVPELLARGHDVVAYDTFWFGDHLPDNDADGDPLTKVRADIRNIETFKAAVDGCDAVIHLACLSNDPSAEMDAALTRSVNFDAFEPLVIAAKEAGVSRFINCSTSSVYGISDAPDVREDHPLVPITPYNTFKAQCEPLLFEHQSDDFECVNLRPSTVCGYSPRQRLDLAVNILTAQAYHFNKIIVFGGEQKRPNLHIEDMVQCYCTLLEAPADKVAGQTFNVGAGNISIADLAAIVKKTTEALCRGVVDIETKPIKDVRSYQVNSDKIADVLGFRPQCTVEDAVHDLIGHFDAGDIPEAMTRDEYVNVKQMRKIFPDLYRGAPEPQVGPQTGILSEIDAKRGAGQ